MPGIPASSSTGRLDPLIDVRAAGGYVIAPGSLAAGRPYTVVNSTPVAVMPSWLAELHEEPGPSTAGSRDLTVPVHHGGAYARAALQAEVAVRWGDPP